MARKHAKSPVPFTDFDFAPADAFDAPTSPDVEPSSYLTMGLNSQRPSLRISSRPRRAPSSPTPTTPHTAMSYAEWQREPSTWDVLFRLQMPYRAPRGKLAVFLWRRRIWIETTFALSMMQPWEKVVVVCMGCLLLGLFATTGYLYFPQHVRYVCGRALYYLLGSELRVPTALKSYLVPWGEINASRPFDVLGIHGDL